MFDRVLNRPLLLYLTGENPFHFSIFIRVKIILKLFKTVTKVLREMFQADFRHALHSFFFLLMLFFDVVLFSINQNFWKYYYIRSQFADIRQHLNEFRKINFFSSSQCYVVVIIFISVAAFITFYYAFHK